MEKILLIGAGGHAKSVIDSIVASNIYRIAGIIDKEKHSNTQIMGIPIIGEDKELPSFLKEGFKTAFVTVGSVGNTRVRQNIYQLLKVIGFIIPNIIDPTAVVSQNVQLGEGAFIGKNVAINAGCKIGDMTIINTASVLEHDCEIGIFSHISPSTTLCGGVKVGNYAHIGANATVIQEVSVGDHVMVGAGSVVLKDIEMNKRVAGVPAIEIDHNGAKK